MTRKEACDAMDSGRKVQAKNFNEADTGRILAIDGTIVVVGWRSGVKTRAHLEDIEFVPTAALPKHTHQWETDPKSNGLIDVCTICGKERA